MVTQARSSSEPELLQAQRRRREPRELERTNGARRLRRRRQSTPWLQRNALSVAAVSVLIAFLGLGFGLIQMMNRSDASTPATLAQVDLATATAGPTLLTASTVGAPVPITGPASGQDTSASGGSSRAIQSKVTVLQPNYTIVGGDTLVKIAQQFNTSVARIQAFNNLSDPRALRVGTKLIIPPPL